MDSDVSRRWNETVRKELHDRETIYREDIDRLMDNLIHEEVRNRSDIWSKYRQTAFMGSLKPQTKKISDVLAKQRGVVRLAIKEHEAIKAEHKLFAAQKGSHMITKEMKEALAEARAKEREARNDLGKMKKEWYETNWAVRKTDPYYVSPEIIRSFQDGLNEVWFLSHFDVPDGAIKEWVSGTSLDVIEPHLLRPGDIDKGLDRTSMAATAIEKMGRAYHADRLAKDDDGKTTREEIRKVEKKIRDLQKREDELKERATRTLEQYENRVSRRGCAGEDDRGCQRDDARDRERAVRGAHRGARHAERGADGSRDGGENGRRDGRQYQSIRHRRDARERSAPQCAA